MTLPALQDAPITHIVLPWPPSVNSYYRRMPNKRAKGGVVTMISDKGREYRDTVARICMIERVREVRGERLQLAVQCYLPDRRRRDLGNIDKALLDALEHAGVFKDDALIRHQRYDDMGREPPGRVEVFIRALAPPAAEQLHLALVEDPFHDDPPF